MAVTKIRIEGLAELEVALKELPRATGKNCLRRALTSAALPIVEYARDLAPVGATGRLKKSIGVSKIKFTGGAAGKAAFAEAMAGGATRQEAGAAARAANAGEGGDITSAVIVIGPGRLRYAGMMEFGTVNHAAQPYMRPAWDAKRSEAADLIKDELKREIDKAAARLARKAARDLAKKSA